MPICQSLQQLKYIFIPLIIDFLFHISGSYDFILLLDLMNKHLSSFSPYLDQAIYNIVLSKTFTTNLMYPFVVW